MVFCTNCGKKNVENADFCTECGKAFGSGSKNENASAKPVASTTNADIGTPVSGDVDTPAAPTAADDAGAQPAVNVGNSANTPTPAPVARQTRQKAAGKPKWMMPAAIGGVVVLAAAIVWLFNWSAKNKYLSEIGDHWRNGVALFEKADNLDAAISHFDAAIKLMEEKYSDEYRLWVLHGWRGKARVVGLAVNLAGKDAVLPLAHPDNVDIVEYLVLIHKTPMTPNTAQILDLAIADFTEAIRLSKLGKDLDTWYIAYSLTERGRVYYGKGEYDEAIRDFSEAISINTIYYKNDAAYEYRALSYFKKNDFDSAIKDFTQLIQLSPNDGGYAYHERGDMYFLKDDFTNAIADYEAALQKNSNRAGTKEMLARAYNGRGAVSFKSRNYSQAIEDFEAALRIAPNDRTIKNNLERVRWHQRSAGGR